MCAHGLAKAVDPVGDAAPGTLLLDEQRRLRALEMAHEAGGGAEAVLMRAAAYLDFLRGQWRKPSKVEGIDG